MTQNNKKYLFEYDLPGGTFAHQLEADSEDHARRLVAETSRALANATYKGEIVSTIKFPQSMWRGAPLGILIGILMSLAVCIWMALK